MPRRIGRLMLHRLRCFFTMHEPEIWEFMAAMAYSSPVALFPYTELARDGFWAPYDAYAWLGIDGRPWLSRRERRIWLELSQELGTGQAGQAGQVQAGRAQVMEGPPS